MGEDGEDRFLEDQFIKRIRKAVVLDSSVYFYVLALFSLAKTDF